MSAYFIENDGEERMPSFEILLSKPKMLFNWLKVVSDTPALLAIRTTVPSGFPSSKHAAETVSPSCLVAQMSAKESRNLRFNTRSFGACRFGAS